MEFEWDESKRLENLRKHGLDFGDCWRVFSGPWTFRLDVRFDYGEPRYQAFGMVHDRVVAVAYVERRNLIRVISMRKATQHEKTQFFETITTLSN